MGLATNEASLGLLQVVIQHPMNGAASTPAEASPGWCEVCLKDMQTLVALEEHRRGKKHLRKAVGDRKARLIHERVQALSESERHNVLRGERSLLGIATRLRRGGQRVVVLLGAGVSTSAGIPDYRGGSGVYSTAAGRGAFSSGGFKADPAAFWALIRQTCSPLRRVEPTVTHRFLTTLHRRGLLQRVYTQNVDGLERAAGVPDDKLVCCHGSLGSARCSSCGAAADAAEGFSMRAGAPCCVACGQAVRPDIVFFDEPLPQRFHELKGADLAACTLLVVAGTSLSVYPFAGLLDECSLTTPRLLINREASGPFLRPDAAAHAYRDVLWLGECDAGVSCLARILGWEEGAEEE